MVRLSSTRCLTLKMTGEILLLVESAMFISRMVCECILTEQRKESILLINKWRLRSRVVYQNIDIYAIFMYVQF